MADVGVLHVKTCMH